MRGAEGAEDRGERAYEFAREQDYSHGNSSDISGERLSIADVKEAEECTGGQGDEKVGDDPLQEPGAGAEAEQREEEEEAGAGEYEALDGVESSAPRVFVEERRDQQESEALGCAADDAVLLDLLEAHRLDVRGGTVVQTK